MHSADRLIIAYIFKAKRALAFFKRELLIDYIASSIYAEISIVSGTAIIV